jgi:hypothetical protein
MLTVLYVALFPSGAAKEHVNVLSETKIFQPKKKKLKYLIYLVV